MKNLSVLPETTTTPVSDMLPAEIEAKEMQLKDGRNIVLRGATKEEIPGS